MPCCTVCHKKKVYPVDFYETVTNNSARRPVRSTDTTDTRKHNTSHNAQPVSPVKPLSVWNVTDSKVMSLAALAKRLSALERGNTVSPCSLVSLTESEIEFVNRSKTMKSRLPQEKLATVIEQDDQCFSKQQSGSLSIETGRKTKNHVVNLASFSHSPLSSGDETLQSGHKKIRSVNRSEKSPNSDLDSKLRTQTPSKVVAPSKDTTLPRLPGSIMKSPSPRIVTNNVSFACSDGSSSKSILSPPGPAEYFDAASHGTGHSSSDYSSGRSQVTINIEYLNDDSGDDVSSGIKHTEVIVIKNNKDSSSNSLIKTEPKRAYSPETYGRLCPCPLSSPVTPPGRYPDGRREEKDVGLKRSLGSKLNLFRYRVVSAMNHYGEDDYTGLTMSREHLLEINEELDEKKKRELGEFGITTVPEEGKCICEEKPGCKSVQCIDATFDPGPYGIPRALDCDVLRIWRHKSLLTEGRQSAEERTLYKMTVDGKPGVRTYLHPDEFVYERNERNERLYIGQGELGMIFVGQVVLDDGSKKPACLKATSEHMYEALYNEFRCLRKLQKTDLVPNAYGLIRNPDKGTMERVGIVMDFIPGMSVRDTFILEIPLTMHDWMKIMLWTARALHCCIEHDVLNNDFKCDSVIMNRIAGNEGTKLKIIDFSHASDAYGIKFPKMQKDARHRYKHIAPEVFRGGYTSVAAEVFSYGAFVWQILVFAKITRNKKDKHRDTVEYTALSKIVKGCMQRLPPQRLLLKKVINRLQRLIYEGECHDKGIIPDKEHRYMQPPSRASKTFYQHDYEKYGNGRNRHRRHGMTKVMNTNVSKEKSGKAGKIGRNVKYCPSRRQYQGSSESESDNDNALIRTKEDINQASHI